jgi:hypothetical protein
METPRKSSRRKPSFARSPAQVSPAGPEPTMATLCPLLSAFFGASALFSLCLSATYLSSLPMATGSPFIPRTHFASHWVSCGQTRPQTDGRELVWEIVLKAPSVSPFDDKRNEIRYLNIYRASLRAGASLTVKAPRSLFGGHFISVAKRDLVKVFISYVRILFYSRDFFIAHIRHLKYLPFAAGTDAPVMAPA